MAREPWIFSPSLSANGSPPQPSFPSCFLPLLSPPITSLLDILAALLSWWSVPCLSPFSTSSALFAEFVPCIPSVFLCRHSLPIFSVCSFSFTACNSSSKSLGLVSQLVRHFLKCKVPENTWMAIWKKRPEPFVGTSLFSDRPNRLRLLRVSEERYFVLPK